MRLVLALALGSFLCAIPAKADNFLLRGGLFAYQLAPVMQSDGTIINCPCGPIVESFQTSFDFDSVSQSVTDMNINSNGPLGPFTFAGVTSNGNAFNPATDFTWSSAMAKIVLNIYDQYLGPGLAIDHSFTLACLSISCVNDFNGIPPGANNDLSTAPTISLLGPSDQPTPTPEPSSILLMGSGLVGLSFLRKLIASAR